MIKPTKRSIEAINTGYYIRRGRRYSCFGYHWDRRFWHIRRASRRVQCGLRNHPYATVDDDEVPTVVLVVGEEKLRKLAFPLAAAA